MTAEYTAEERREIIMQALDVMEQGESLNAFAEGVSINVGTLWGWLHADVECVNRYENSKMVRARAFFERAIYEAQNDPDYKRGESRARTYMRLAAVLNVQEFSEKALTTAKAGQIRKPVSFTLTFTGAAPEQVRELRVIEHDVQPEDGELP